MSFNITVVSNDDPDIPAHRLAWKMFYGAEPFGQVDHIDGNRDNNKIINLRLANQSENSQNQKKARADNKSGFLGVSTRSNGRFSATIGIGRKRIHLGTYSSPEDAHKAYLQAKEQIHPFSTLKG